MAIQHRFLRVFSTLDIEERILNGSSIIALCTLLFPWVSGEWLGGDAVSYNGFGFYTSFLGIVIFLLHLVILALTVSPMAGGPVLIRRSRKEVVRLCLASQAAILTLASLSVLTKVTYEFSRIEIRFGIYLTLISSIVTTIYAFLKWQEQRSSENQDLFHHPEDPASRAEVRNESVMPPPPPPPPPPPLSPEEHHVRM